MNGDLLGKETCRGCKAPILWIRQVNGKRHPCNPDLRQSWVTGKPVTTSHRIVLFRAGAGLEFLVPGDRVDGGGIPRRRV